MSDFIVSDLTKSKTCGIRMFGNVVVGSKGQVVIPRDVRNELGISPGDSLVVITKYGKAIGMVKSDDFEVFMEYMKQEMEMIKRMVADGSASE